MNSIPTEPLPTPTPPDAVRPEAVTEGQPIPPIDRLRILSPTQWEDFILEWAHSLRDKYVRVERCGGAGDKGRDVIGIVDEKENEWENYQCKHYKHPLMPSDIWRELGKVIFYSYEGIYSPPQSYYFVAPQGVGTSLSNLLKEPDTLRQRLLSEWPNHCENHILSTSSISLIEPLQAYISSFDFSIFGHIPPLKILDAHANTRWHVTRFGGGLPERPTFDKPPEEPAPHESRFIRELLRAYADYIGRPLPDPSALSGLPNLERHFVQSRLEFYSAEALRVFARDNLPPGMFTDLQNEFYDGIIDVLLRVFPDGYQRLQSAVERARLLGLSSHPLRRRVTQKDRGGICHQLANEGRVEWTQ